MLSFGRFYITIKTKGSYTESNGRRVEYDKDEEQWFTLEPMKDSMYGYVKTNQKAMRDTSGYGYQKNGIWREESLYDLVDMTNGYVLARTFKTDLKVVLEHFKQSGFVHIEDGLYTAGTFVLHSHRRYRTDNGTGQSNTIGEGTPKTVPQI